MEYKVYNSQELVSFYQQYKENAPLDNDVCNFYTHLKNQEPKKRLIMPNSVEDNKDIKTNIIQLLNKLNEKTLKETIKRCKMLEFHEFAELEFFIVQCINKIKRENGQIKIIYARLCWELQQCVYTIHSEKHKFRDILFKKVREDFKTSLMITTQDWNKKDAEQTMILFGILYSQQIMPSAIIENLIQQLEEHIVVHEKVENYNVDNCEKALFMLTQLVGNINDFSDVIFKNFEDFIVEQIEKHRSSQQIIRISMQNILEQIKK